jgi:hypothetical protein
MLEIRTRGPGTLVTVGTLKSLQRLHPMCQSTRPQHSGWKLLNNRGKSRYDAVWRSNTPHRQCASKIDGAPCSDRDREFVHPTAPGDTATRTEGAAVVVVTFW